MRLLKVITAGARTNWSHLSGILKADQCGHCHLRYGAGDAQLIALDVERILLLQSLRLYQAISTALCKFDEGSFLISQKGGPSCLQRNRSHGRLRRPLCAEFWGCSSMGGVWVGLAGLQGLSRVVKLRLKLTITACGFQAVERPTAPASTMLHLSPQLSAYGVTVGP